jgi:hypothetical protein
MNLFGKKFKTNGKKWFQKNYKIILCIVFFVLLLVIVCIYITRKKIESFSTTSEDNADLNTGSYAPMKHPILTDCLNNYGKTNSNINCDKSAWVTNPRFLCGICDILNSGDVNYFTKEKVNYYGCNQNVANSVDSPPVTWTPPADTTINKLSGYFKDRMTCNYFSEDKKSDLYLIIICDDMFDLKLNDKYIVKNSTTNNSNWNKLFLLYVPDVKFGDSIHLRGINTCGPGGISFSYIWNKQLYIMENNGFNGYANIIRHYLDKLLLGSNATWTTLWKEYVPQLPPWMQNYIKIDDSPICSFDKENQREVNISFDIGDSADDGNLKPYITCFIACDVQNMELLLNDSVVYTKMTDTNTLDTITIDNVNDGDIFTIHFNRIFGGNIMIMMLWGGLLYTFDGGLNPGDNGMSTFQSSTINTFTLLDSKGNPFHGSISYNNDLPDSLKTLAIINKWATVSDNFSIKMKLPDAKIDNMNYFQGSPKNNDNNYGWGINPKSDTGIGYQNVQNIITVSDPNKAREYTLISDSTDLRDLKPITTYKSQITDSKLIVEDCGKKCDKLKNCDAFTLDTKTNMCQFFTLPQQNEPIRSIWGIISYIFPLFISKKNTSFYIAGKDYTQKQTMNYATSDNIMFDGIFGIKDEKSKKEDSGKIFCNLLQECRGFTIAKTEDPTKNNITFLHSIPTNGIENDDIDSYVIE